MTHRRTPGLVDQVKEVLRSLVSRSVGNSINEFLTPPTLSFNALKLNNLARNLHFILIGSGSYIPNPVL